ncbi:hypothetical protein [Pseudobacteriovorax antillogorgiicola]|uniref:Uncharacterized protein n=1 Tax=Pseudobacteriovorax antillogorgiicola TaxID=1513793 RepID=A0A1Y6B6U3_9BACT|nr:hypothetical protein [Pseudobacteriovorax antillogorgiicola]TCS59563.1 hypothetical protein EDD56_101483 [Pseudobacteriovorax antillogorgiicola]SME87707.1 hypothetical protein SAMN06296036_1012 [Pseudobacteriovorax antillogorgiicola]
MADESLKGGSSYLIDFLEHFSALMEYQLNHIRGTMEGTVDTVMEGVKNISSITEQKRKAAEDALEQAYFNPDAETQVLVDGLQKMIDDLFDEVKDKFEKGEDLSALTTADPEVLLQNRLKRFDSKFMRDMRNVKSLDDDLQNFLLGMIGALSSEDVIAQRLDHVIMALKVLQTGLNYVLIDYDNRCNIGELEKVTTDIKNYTFRQYTTEDEKNEFLTYFPDLKKSS